MSGLPARFVRASLRGCLIAAVSACASSAPGAESPSLPSALRVCIDPGNLPFSNTSGEGIENKIAELFGAKLGLKVEYYAFPQRMGFIRNTLRYKLPGEDYKCDVVLGIPAGYDQVSSTKPYYRSTYALVFPKGKALDRVRSGAELFGVPNDTQKKLRIGVYDKSPAATWLAKHGWEDQAKIYPILSPNPEQYPGEIIERDLAAGAIDAAIFVDSLEIGRVRVIVARLGLTQRLLIGCVAVHFIGAHENERRLGAHLARGFEQIHCAERVDLEIEQGDFGGFVMRWLRGAMKDQVEAVLAEQRHDAFAVADVERGWSEAFRGIFEPLQIP